MKTVGFWRTLQPVPEPKLTAPWTSQDPSGFWQFRGPPESPYRVHTQWGEGEAFTGGSYRQRGDALQELVFLL